MDVRCARCQTEYELDDNSVADEGTPVQCTACGNTFTVTRAPVVPPPVERQGTPAPAEWLLETTEGPAHRFRNLTSLQKWIIERKVTRDDRISRTGHAWRRLGEIIELAPFFDVVDEADQARAAVLTAADGGKRSGTPPAGTAAGSRDSYPFGEAGTDLVRVRSTSVVRLVILVAVAAMVAYAGISQLWNRTTDGGGSAGRGNPGDRAVSEPARVAAPAASPTAQLPPAAAANPPADKAPAAPEPGPGSSPQVAAQAEPAVTPAATSVTPSATPAPASPAPARSPASDAAPPRAGPPPSYARLIADADRLLETGGTERARRLYEQALGLRPTGAEALAGLGYAALDVGHKKQALVFFKRSVSQRPPFPPALFGLGEVYREQGRDALALEQYRRYVDLDPAGVDVLAARRQIEILEAHVASRAANPTAQPSP
jgi:predicted Zn finger-like uncharacterized protein